MRLGLAAIGAMLAFAASAQSAAAATVCVDTPSSAGCLNGINHPTLTDGLFAAGGSPGRDEVRIGPTTLNERVLHPNPTNNPVDIVGSGQGPDGTVMRSNTAQAALVLSEASSTVSNMRFVVPADLGNNPAGLDLGKGQAHDVTVVGEPGTVGAAGIYLREETSLRNVTVTLDVSQTSDAISVSGTGTHTIEDAVLTAGTMVNLSGPESKVVARRLRTSAPCFICLYVDSGNELEISDSLVLVGPQDTYGLWAQNAPVTVRNLTIVGSGGTSPVGIRALGSAGGTSAVQVLDTIVRNIPTPLQRTTLGGGTANLSVDYSNFELAKISNGGAGTFADGGHNIDADPLFANPGAGDFRLATGSPAADRGSPAGGATALDLAGAPRLLDANADGIAQLDMGAYEYQGPPFGPPLPGDVVGPRMSIVGKRVTMDARGRIKLRLRCPAAEPAPCAGQVALATARKVKPARRRIVALGRKAFAGIAPGKRGTVTIKLSPKKRRLVRRLKKLKVKLTATATDQAGNAASSTRTLTLKAAKKPKKR